MRFISNNAGFRPGLETAGTGAVAAAATAAPLAVDVVVGDSLNLVHLLASLVAAVAAAGTDPVAAVVVVVGFSTFGELEILRVLIGGVIVVTVISPRLELLLLA